MASTPRKPKWLELADGEKLLHTYLLNESNLLALWLLVFLGILAAIYSGYINASWEPLGIVYYGMGSAILALTALRGQIALEHPGRKFHLTSNRVIVEERQKPTWVGEIERIKTIGIKRKVIGGIVEIRFVNPDDPAISAYSIFPAAMANEIQVACANANSNNQEGEA